MRSPLLPLIVLLAGCNLQPAPDSAADVIAAERAFAERALDIGWVGAFREFSTADSVMAAGAGLTPTADALDGAPEGDRSLYWAPAFAGIARSGDLGFTTGGFSVDESRTLRGQYFTVWQRQADGGWKWIYDGGPGGVSDPPRVPPADARVVELPVARDGAGTIAAAEVEALERSLAGPGAIAAHLAPDARVYRRGHRRALGGSASLANLQRPSDRLEYRLVRVEASAAGDLAFALGEVSWTEDGLPRAGSFARIWQYRDGNWLVVYDQVAEQPPAATGE